MGSRNHEIVPLKLITEISKLRSGGVLKLLIKLSHKKLIKKIVNKEGIKF